MSQAILRTWKE